MATIIEQSLKEYEDVEVVDIKYPKVIALKNKLIEEKINKTIVDKVYELIDLQKIDKEVVNLFSNYNIQLNEKSLISTQFCYYSSDKSSVISEFV